MSLPFYVSPEQVMQDKAEYARKGIGRGKSSITLEYAGGIDTVRGIFPTVIFCSARGIEQAREDEISAAYQRIVGSREGARGGRQGASA